MILYRYIDLPPTINAVTVVDENGDYNVYMNSHLTHDDELKAWLHEETHIKQDHFYDPKLSLEECEEIANGKLRKEGKRKVVCPLPLHGLRFRREI